MAEYRQFTIYWCNLEPAFGHQIKKTCPCVIVSPDEMNDLLGTVVVVPLTSTARKFPFYLPVQYHNRQSAFACDQIKTINKRRVVKPYATLTKKDSLALSNILTSMFQAIF